MSAPVAGFEVLGEIAGMYAPKAAPRYLLQSLDGTSVCVAKKHGDSFVPVAGPFTLDTIRRCAENVIAGNSRAITWPDAQMALAAGCAALFLEFSRLASGGREETADEPRESAP